MLIVRNEGDFSRTLHKSDFANLGRITAAKAALRRKKALEKNAEQTSAQILQLEQQVYSIEAANINHETLVAMERAGKAMQQIHNGMNIDKVDKTMYVDLTQEQDKLSWEGLAELLLCFSKREGQRHTNIFQGGLTGATRTQRRNRAGDHGRPAGRAARRGRVGAGTGGSRAGADGRAHAQYWSYASHSSTGPTACCRNFRS